MQVVVVSSGSNRDVIKSAMNRWSIEPVFCAEVREVRGLLSRAGRSLIFCEEQLSDGSYRDLLRELGRTRRALLVVISTSSDLDRVYREAIALGAFETIASPCRPGDVQWVAIRALQDSQRRSGYRGRKEYVSNDPSVSSPKDPVNRGTEKDLPQEPG